ncbi:hypothetical protein A2U01_0103482, partial [Trifolium medium]|nr:hypothetical protein [Trifolium medium]
MASPELKRSITGLGRLWSRHGGKMVPAKMLALQCS